MALRGEKMEQATLLRVGPFRGRYGPFEGLWRYA